VGTSSTPNLGLDKPDYDEFFDVDTWNANADKIDAAMAGKASGTDSRLTDKRVPVDGSVGDVQVSSVSPSKVKDLPYALLGRERRPARPATAIDHQRHTRSITRDDILVSRNPTNDMGYLKRPLHRKTLFAALGKTECIYIDRDFARLTDIASVGWHLNDSSLAGGSTTPGTSAIATTTSAPHSLGGMSANGEMIPWAMAEVSSWASYQTLSILVTYRDGTKETATAQIYPCNAYLSTNFNTMLIGVASGANVTVGPGVYDFRGVSNTTTRAALATLTATDNVIVDCSTGVSMASLSGSNVAFVGPGWEWLGGLMIRGQDITLDGGTGRQWFSYPYWLAPGSEGASRCLQIDGIAWNGTSGNQAKRVTVRHAVVDTSVSDLLNTSRAEDVLIDDVVFGDTWDLVSNSHYDGLQISGLITASGSLVDAEGDAVGLLVRNSTWYGSNLLVKPDLGPMAAVTFEGCHWVNSGRVGVQLQAGNSTTNLPTWVKFRNCTSVGHSNTDFSNNPVSGVYVPVKTRRGVLSDSTAAFASTDGELTYGAPVTSAEVPLPPELLIRPLSPRAGDITKVTNINGTSVSISRPGVSGYGATHIVTLLLNDETAALSLDSAQNVLSPTGAVTGLTYVGSSSQTGGGKLWVLQLRDYAGSTPGPWSIAFSKSTTGVAMTIGVSWAGRGIEQIVFATPSTVNAGDLVTAPSVSSAGRNRYVQWIWGVTGAGSAGTWTTKPITVGGGQPLPITTATQINTVEASSIGVNAALLAAYRPQPYKTPGGTQGTVQAGYSLGGAAFAVGLVLGPSREAPSRSTRIPGLNAESIPVRINGLSQDNLATAIAEVYRLASIAAGEVVTPQSFDVKGDILAATGNDTYTVIPVGASGTILRPDPASPTGLSYGIERGAVYVHTAQTLLTNSTTETVVFGPYTIPAGSVAAGRTYEIELYGTADNISSGSCNLRIRVGGLGGSSFGTLGITSASAKTNQSWRYAGTVTFRATSGTAVPTMGAGLLFNATANTTAASVPTSATNVNTSAAKDLVVTGTWGGADPGNVLRVEGGVIRLVY
jgi:hypothetical protein